MRPSRGMGAIAPSKRPKTGTRKVECDVYAKGGATTKPKPPPTHRKPK